MRTTWDYQEKRSAYVEWATRTGATIPMFNAPSIIQWNTHKSYLREYLGKIELCERVPPQKAAPYRAYLDWYRKVKEEA